MHEDQGRQHVAAQMGGRIPACQTSQWGVLATYAGCKTVGGRSPDPGNGTAEPPAGTAEINDALADSAGEPHPLGEIILGEKIKGWS